jgi:hypothetical protein
MLEPAGKPMPGPDGVIVVPKGGLWSMQAVVSTGVFNPTTATCGDPCGSCCGYDFGSAIVSNFCGVYRNAAYDLVDQRNPAQAIDDTYTISEIFSDFSSTAPGDGLPLPATITVSPTASPLTDSQWLDYDMPTPPACLSSGQYDTLTQSFQVTASGVHYNLVTTVALERGFFGGALNVLMAKSNP